MDGAAEDEATSCNGQETAVSRSDRHTGLSGTWASWLECYQPSLYATSLHCMHGIDRHTAPGQVASGLRAPKGVSLSLHRLVFCPSTNSVSTLI